MDKVLEEIADIIQEYNTMNVLDIERLNHLLKALTTRLYYLETVRSTYHNNYVGIQQKYIKEGDSVSGAKNKAELEVPELYMLRRIMQAGYENVGAMRTNISYLKSEMRNV